MNNISKKKLWKFDILKILIETNLTTSYMILPLSHNTWHSWPYYAYQCIILSLNILNNILEKTMNIWYFENTHPDESNDILYDIIYRCILVEKYCQSKLGQNCTFSTRSSIAGRRDYYLSLYINKKIWSK